MKIPTMRLTIVKHKRGKMEPKIYLQHWRWGIVDAQAKLNMPVVVPRMVVVLLALAAWGVEAYNSN
jgi:hypothetical protein